MTGARFVVRLAWREGRASVRRFLVLVAAVAVGVAALVAINSYTENMQASVGGRAQALLGADLRIQSRRQVPDRVAALIDTLASSPADVAHVTYFGAMGYVPRTAGARTVNVTAIEGGYPFYGEIATEPAGVWGTLQSGRNVLVDPALLTALEAGVGDTLALGEARFAITGTILNFPGDIGIGSAFAPRVVIPARFLEETKLLQFGARSQYATYLRLADPSAGEAVADRYRPILRADRVSIRSAADDQQGTSEALGRLASYLGLVALIALLLGGLGVASAVHVFIRQKLDTIAVLRCLGATSRQIFAVYLLQAAAMGLVGSAVGALLGVGIQLALPRLLADFIPVDVIVRPSWRAILVGVGTGLWVALIFSLLPLLSARRVPPLAALRRAFESASTGARRRRDPLRIPAVVALAASIVGLAAVQVGEWQTGLIFAGGIAVALGTLWFAAWLLIRLVRRWFPSRWPYVWRQGLANLYRPANQTVTVILALGFGTFLLSTLFLVQHNLLRSLDLAGGAARPNLVLIDIQPDQRAGVEAELHEAGLPAVGPVPIVPMRIQSIAGRDVAEIAADTAGVPEDERPASWALRREYRSTYRDSLVASERITLGEWRTDDSTAISIEAGVAEELGVELGDEVVWDIQGVPLTTRVTSVREVDWARFEPNFFVVFSPRALQSAPQTLVTLTRVDDAAARGRMQRLLAERFPNVTTIDLSLLQETIERVLDRVVLAIRFMALFSLATGTLVLFGAVATSRFQRVREAVLLKTLGATRRQIFRIVLAEYLALGAMAALTAVALASAAGWGLAHYLFETSYAVPLPALGGLTAAVVGLTVVVGVATSLEAVRKPPLEVLRDANAT